MNVQQVYDKYEIPLNLQKHMLRVTALSQILAENWKKIILDKDLITFTCVFHDMANVIKFNFDKPSLFKEEENRIGYWKKRQTEMIKKYGNNVHLATLKICKEIGLSTRVLKLMENFKWDNTLEALKQQNFELAISIYCDMRIGPFGIMSLQDRLINLQTRHNSFNFDFIIKSVDLLEKSLQKYISINIESVSDSELNVKFDQILKLKIT